MARIIKSLVYSTALFGAVALGTGNIAYSADVTAESVERLQSVMQKMDYSQSLKLIASLTPELQQRLDIRFYRATSLAGVGKNREAIEALERLIEEEPNHPEFYNNLAMLLVEEGKLLEAQQTLELGLRSRESYAMLYNNLTIVFETMARRSYARALQIKGESPALKPLVAIESFTPPLPTEPVTLVAAVDKEISQPSENRQLPETPAAMPEVRADESTSALNRQIEERLFRWIDNWQKRDIEGYINSYSPNFKSRGYSSREAWLKGRSDRIGKARKIVISIEGITIEALSSNRVQADFVMDYRSDRYSDRSKKRVIFKQIGGQWRIVRELTLKVISS